MNWSLKSLWTMAIPTEYLGVRQVVPTQVSKKKHNILWRRGCKFLYFLHGKRPRSHGPGWPKRTTSTELRKKKRRRAGFQEIVRRQDRLGRPESTALMHNTSLNKVPTLSKIEIKWSLHRDLFIYGAAGSGTPWGGGWAQHGSLCSNQYGPSSRIMWCYIVSFSRTEPCRYKVPT